MAMAERTASTEWDGDLAHGNGSVTVNSGAFGPFPVTWASRTERSDGKTSPEELIAAAHAACFAMAFSNTLNTNGTPPERLMINAVCSLERTESGLKVSAMDLDVRGRVPGLDQAGFEQQAKKAEQGCPVSNALRNNVQISVHAQLEQP
jgi:osmotically inducible protein OsmC